jgi:hypothetical protein
MSPSTTARSTSQRGLLAGLLALVLFASSAVAMTAHGTSGPTGTGADAAQPVAAGATAQTFDDGDRHDHGPRSGR